MSDTKIQLPRHEAMMKSLEDAKVVPGLRELVCTALAGKLASPDEIVEALAQACRDYALGRKRRIVVAIILAVVDEMSYLIKAITPSNESHRVLDSYHQSLLHS